MQILPSHCWESKGLCGFRDKRVFLHIYICIYIYIQIELFKMLVVLDGNLHLWMCIFRLPGTDREAAIFKIVFMVNAASKLLPSKKYLG